MFICTGTELVLLDWVSVSGEGGSCGLLCRSELVVSPGEVGHDVVREDVIASSRKKRSHQLGATTSSIPAKSVGSYSSCRFHA